MTPPEKIARKLRTSLHGSAVVLEKRIDQPASIRDIEADLRPGRILRARIAELIGLHRIRSLIAGHEVLTMALETPSTELVAPDITALKLDYNLIDTAFTSHRRFIGPALIAMRNLVKEMIAPVLARQVRYNRANAEVVATLKRDLASMHREHAELQAKVARLESLLAERQSAPSDRPRE